jgi:predicted transcriptional regulator
MSIADPALFVSLKPRFAEMILRGEKTVELRRVRPSLEAGSLVIFYASSPKKQVVGTSRIAKIETASPTSVWASHGEASGLTRAEYREYFAGVHIAVAISLTDVQRLPKAIPLDSLRQRWAGFRPPQSFRYIDAAKAAVVL